MSHFNSYPENQWLFDRVFSGLWIAAKLLLKSLIYLPLWFTGYMLTFEMLTKQHSPLLWLLLTLFFAFLLYQLLFFLKGITVACKQNGHAAWIPLFLVIAFYTSVVPAWISFDTFHSLSRLLTTESAELFAYIFSISFGLYVYSRYQFLTDAAPALALPSYRFGLNLVSQRRTNRT